MELCKRLLSGDLRDQFEKEVIKSPESDEHTSMMAMMNIMCGNITMDCAYAAQAHWDQVKGARNVFEDLGKSHFMAQMTVIVMTIMGTR